MFFILSILLYSANAISFTVMFQDRIDAEYFNNQQIEVSSTFLNDFIKRSIRITNIVDREFPYLTENVDINCQHSNTILKDSVSYITYHWITRHEKVCVPNVGIFQKSNQLTDLAHWVADRNYITPLHYDTGDGYLWCTNGTKLVFLFPPEDRENLYMVKGSEGHLTTPPYILEKINISIYPNVKKTISYVSVLKSGSLLYIPRYWSHHVYTQKNSRCFSVWVL